MVENLDKLYKLTSETLGIPIYKVKHIIEEGQYKYVSEWIVNPDKPALFLINLGSFNSHLPSILRRIKRKILPRIREDRSKVSLYQKEFTFLWGLKNKVNPFLRNKRRRSRPNIRFGKKRITWNRNLTEDKN